MNSHAEFRNDILVAVRIASSSSSSSFLLFLLSRSIGGSSFFLFLFDHLMGIACSVAAVISICRIFGDSFITSFNYLISAPFDSVVVVVSVRYCSLHSEEEKQKCLPLHFPGNA